MLWETEWWSIETYASLGFPLANLPFSRWSALWTDLGRMGWEAYALTGSVLLVLSTLFLWARHRDRQHEYQAYMPTWYRAASDRSFDGLAIAPLIEASACLLVRAQS